MYDNQEKRDRFEVGFQIFNKWLFLKQRGLSLSAYFFNNCIRTIAIYGMSSLGERLFDELIGSSVQVLYGIDRMAEAKTFKKIPIYGLTETVFPTVDAIVATPAQAYWEISDTLKALTELPVLSLEDIVQSCYDAACSNAK